MKPLFYHYHLVELIGVGPMGTWLKGVITGTRFLVPSGPTNKCVGRTPIWEEDPCPHCGWTSNVIQTEGFDQ